VEIGWTPLIASLKLGGSFALAALGNLILIPVVLFYLLSEWERWVAHVVAWVPARWRFSYDSFMHECDCGLRSGCCSWTNFGHACAVCSLCLGADAVSDLI
jgi:hypothetical protein